ncbi:hypothetical protein OIU34_17265 [Pararhizobium sp. BT-229]|uniref:hypothetical protein n=1 Tax=Pararhizobium sp. BT-229 TaxID=2986923 RepID=UPI0021F6BA67|nr:hypothetical protein [Pararhizobium sp. BT-229]MCV9963652.1 hypothetical protein [Pararhizobium sp. BT-229]
MQPLQMNVGEGIAALTDPVFGEDVPASEFFVKGGCHQLALALVSAIEGARFVAVYDHLSDDGSPLEDPRMVHAAAMIGQQLVIDVEGIKERDVWVEAWSDLARDPSYIEWEPDELPFEFTSAAHMRFSEAVAARLVEELAPLLSLPSQLPPARCLRSFI